MNARTDAEPRFDERAVSARAFEIFRQRTDSGAPGDAMSDWLQAERELAANACRLPAGGAAGDAINESVEHGSRPYAGRRSKPVAGRRGMARSATCCFTEPLLEPKRLAPVDCDGAALARKGK